MKTQWKAAAAAGLMAVGITGCVTDPVTGQRSVDKRFIGGGLGGVAGYLLGDLVGGRNDRTAKIIGAGIGGVAGAAVGDYMQKQEQRLRERTAGTGIDVTRQGDQLILNMPGDVTFDTGQSTVKPQFQSVLDSVASTLAEYPSTYIDVLGHTDSVGSDISNQSLSERRAMSVASYLSGRGVAMARIATRGYGETALKCAPEVTDADRQCNRRVEIRVNPVTQNDVNAVR